MVQLSLTRLFDIYGRSLRCQYIVAVNLKDGGYLGWSSKWRTLCFLAW